MKKNVTCPTLDPAQQLCPNYDSRAIKLDLSRQRESMGIPILDNCAEEHAQ